MRRCAVLALVVVAALYAGACGGTTSPSAGGAAGNAAVSVGDTYGGGIVAYILVDGDSGYVPGETHGLIAATADQTAADSGIIWASAERVLWTDTAIGAGSANTDTIIADNGAGSAYAAGLARACTDGGHSDWYLPSKDELNKVYLKRAAIGGFASAIYWSSSEGNAVTAWFQVFADGAQGLQSCIGKDKAARVRAIRAF